MLKIRIHHLLCMQYFIGNGYSKEFVDNLYEVISKLEKEDSFILTLKEDDICKCCPFNNKGICKDINKVSIYDMNVLDKLNLKENNIYSYKELKQLILKNIIDNGNRKKICNDCEWNYICSKFDK